MKIFCAAALLLLSSLAFAKGRVREPLPKPCRPIADACEAAGFHHHGHKEHKGLWKDCVAPILDGGAVAGVTVSPDDVRRCQAVRPKNRG